jgi:hypothetical protein
MGINGAWLRVGVLKPPSMQDICFWIIKNFHAVIAFSFWEQNKVIISDQQMQQYR